jgi:hypothetical protein
MILQALSELRPNCNVEVVFNNDGSYTITRYQHEEPQPTEEEIQAKIQELEAAEPLRLLRIQRNQILQQSDWEVQRNQERNITDTALIEYRNALRDLPQKIEAEEIEAPTLSETGELVFEHWPVRGE